jgi:hypothetical protein
MGTSFELVGSFIIGGLFLLSILGFQDMISETNYQNTLNIIAQQSATEVVSFLQYDLRKIGYRVSVSVDAITTFNDSVLTFLADIDQDWTVETVTYRLGSPSLSVASDNPHDRRLIRSVDGSNEDVASGVTTLEFRYFDGEGNETALASDIRIIQVSFNIQTTYGFNGFFGRAAYQGRFVPENLKGF